MRTKVLNLKASSKQKFRIWSGVTHHTFEECATGKTSWQPPTFSNIDVWYLSVGWGTDHHLQFRFAQFSVAHGQDWKTYDITVCTENNYKLPKPISCCQLSLNVACHNHLSCQVLSAYKSNSDIQSRPQTQGSHPTDRHLIIQYEREKFSLIKHTRTQFP